MQPVIKGKLKKWGNSMGIIIPKEIIEQEKLKENQEVELLMLRDSKKVLKEMWGSLKTGRSAQEIKDELRRELYDD